MRAFWPTLAVLVFILAVSPNNSTSVGKGGGEKLDDEDVPKLGVVAGIISPTKNLKGLKIIERGMGFEKAVKVDGKTGKFRVEGLLPGSYDLVVDVAWGRIEGIDMSFQAGEFDDLVPEEHREDPSDADEKVPPKPTKDDLAAIRKHIHKVKRYENKIRDIYIIGNGARVTVLVELIRDAAFYGKKGDEMTWRLERWYYSKKYGAWQRVHSNVLYRKRLSKRVFLTWTRQFEPSIGGLTIERSAKKLVTVLYKIPKHPTRGKGLVSVSYSKEETEKKQREKESEKEKAPESKKKSAK